MQDKIIRKKIIQYNQSALQIRNDTNQSSLAMQNHNLKIQTQESCQKMHVKCPRRGKMADDDKESDVNDGQH